MIFSTTRKSNQESTARLRVGSCGVATGCWREMQVLVVNLGLALALSCVASAATVNFVQQSVNDADGSTISAVNSNQWIETAQTYTTDTAPMEWEGNRFTYWTISSEPSGNYRDAWGRSQNPISVTIYENTTATAHYLPATLDSDGDGIPDWHEIEYYGTLVNGAVSDTDGDGLTLLQEFNAGTNSLFPNASQAGGVSYADSDIVTVNLAGYPTYTFSSSPSGMVDQTSTAEPGRVVTSPALDQPTFGYWAIDEVRQQDAWGVALRQISFTMVSTNREAVAYFFDADSDGDGLPDAWEQYYFGNLNFSGTDAPNGDGITLAAKFATGSNPRFSYASQAGGISYADSEMVTVNLAEFSRYTISSDPAETLNQSAVVAPGSVITTPEMPQATFGYWTVDGIEQRDAWGVALRQCTFTMEETDRNVVAHFFSGDSDGDGVNDGFEYYYSGTLANGANSDTNGDGRTLLQDYLSGSSPVFGVTTQAGGVSWANSALLVVNAQIFERSTQAQVNGVLSPLFSFDPKAPTGRDFGSKSAPVLGDFDGDEDLDLMVFHSTGMVVFENVGTRATMNFTDRTAAFGVLTAAIAGNGKSVAAMSDWTGDGRADLVLGGATGTLQFFVSTGNFSNPLVPAEFTISTGSARSLPALADLNGDGTPDLLVILADGSSRFYAHTGNPSAPYTTFTTDFLGVPVPNATSLGVADVNGDGRLDVLAADQDGRIWDFRRLSGGGFSLQSKVWAGSGAGFADGLTISVADIDGDGDADFLAGTDGGSLLYLRDPHLGRPADLRAVSGASSILLNWAPDAQSRLRGYNVYRADGTPSTWNSLLTDPIRLPTYRDEALVSGTTYSYRVTAVSYAYLPGNSTPKILETEPSDVAVAESGRVNLSLQRTRGKPANYVKMPVSIENSMGLRGAGMQISISYDPAVMIPAAQADTSRKSVHKTGLSSGLQITDNGAAANGMLMISGVSGEFEAGEGKLFTLEFKVKESAALGLKTAVGISSAGFYSTGGQAQSVDIAGSEFVEIEAAFTPGDVNGDGVLTVADDDLLKNLTKPKSRAAIPEEVRAGDLNGDGKLTQLDVVLLKRLLQGLPVDQTN